MISVILCLLAFIASLIASRRSLVAGLAVLFGIGYLYGITRANLPTTFSHFIFDAAVLGLYANQLFRPASRDQQIRTQKLRLWVAFLMIWPTLLFLMPVQDTMVEMVGLRGNIFLLPFLLLGARLEGKDIYKLTLWIAVFNLMAFAFAVAQFFLGIQMFFPKNPVTEIIYASNDVIANSSAYRIPACFSSAAAYGGMMSMTLLFLVGAWVQKDKPLWHRALLIPAMVASILGTFLSASRTPFIFLVVITVAAIFSIRMKPIYWASLTLILLCIGWAVSSEARLQRFMTLQDTDYVSDRISISVNKGFFDRAIEYPLGNGLGGGGTSMPYFLRDRVKRPVLMENEYGRIMLEQGVPGLCLWIAFIFWVFTRRYINKQDPWYLTRRLAWIACAMCFATGLMGVGLLTALPGTCLILLCTGWIAVRQPINADKPITVPYRFANERQVLAQ